jgi:hypothetical protein
MGSGAICKGIPIALVSVMVGGWIWAEAPKFDVHDMNRPMSPVVNPGTPSTQEKAGTAPSDAIVLFDGNDLSKWQTAKNEPAKWKVENGYAEVVKKTGNIQTKEGFGDCQLHVEWMSPNPPVGKGGQDQGNSGVFLMSVYEIQVLDTYKNLNKTYADGQAGAVYGQTPPQVNPALPPGQWQSYDIVFHRPHFGADGKVTKPARVTILFNGVLVQDNMEITGATAHKKVAVYKPHADKMPLALQDHGHPVRYRNIWIRPLKETAE